MNLNQQIAELDVRIRLINIDIDNDETAHPALKARIIKDKQDQIDILEVQANDLAVQYCDEQDAIYLANK